MPKNSKAENTIHCGLLLCRDPHWVSLKSKCNKIQAKLKTQSTADYSFVVIRIGHSYQKANALISFNIRNKNRFNEFSFGISDGVKL